jgi:serine/threonine protein kinase
MKSDIFALGCILYELVFAEKAFLHDYHIFEYTFSKSKPKLPSLPPQFDDRLKAYITQLLLATLEIDWCRRPSARELLKVLNDIRDGSVVVYGVKEVSMIVMPFEQEPIWEKVEWKQYW